MIRGRRARLRPLNGRPRPKPQSNGRKRRKRDAKGRFLPAKGRDPFREARASRGFFGMSGVRGPSGPMGRPSRLERLGDRRLRGAPRKRPNGKPTLTRAQAMALAKRVTRQMHEERGPVFSAASRDRYERAARKKKRGPLLAEMAKRSRKMRKLPRGNAPDRYTISAQTAKAGQSRVLAQTGSKGCAVRDANRAHKWGYKYVKIIDGYTDRRVGWRGK